MNSKRPSASTGTTTAPSSSWPTSTTSTATTTLAVDYYKRCTDRPPVPLAAWINLGILYEDEMRFRDAEQCYRQVLAHEPNHPRARLFVKDCQASKGMYYDEEAERGYTVLKQLHEIPVTDFELSVRSRNCLRKMNIRTLGDLTRTTEAALLSSKNFGETSLAEIKDMMHAKGLRLGMALEGSDRSVATQDHRVEPPQEVPPELQALLIKPIGDLNLSVRARKCMSKLNIQTVGDLAQAHRRRAAGVQELRRDLAQRSPRQADHAGAEAQERLIGSDHRTPPRGRIDPEGGSSGERGPPHLSLSLGWPGPFGQGIALDHLLTDRRSDRVEPSGAVHDPGQGCASAARLGRLETPHGAVETPAFMPVGNQATVKGLTPDQIRATGTRMLLANTYHLALRPGEERGRRARRPALVHGLGRSDPDRLGWVPGLQPGGPEPDQ